MRIPGHLTYLFWVQVSDIYLCAFHWQQPALEVEEVLKGFSSEAVISIAGLLVLSAGLVRSGEVRWITERLNDIAGGRKRLTLMSSLVPGILSSFVSDIATVS